MLVILVFLALIPASKHLHLVLSPFTVFLKSPVLGTVPNLDFEKEEVGTETVKDLARKQVLDAFTCVECGRCQDNCPAFGSGKALNPKTLILNNQHALLEGAFDRRMVEVYDEGVLWQCTTCGACESQCPVGIEHLPLIIGARRGLVSNGEAPDYLGNVYNQLERRGNIWGLTYEPRQKFVESAGLEIFDAARHEYLVWLGCAGAFEADFQKSLRALFDILRARGVRFGVLAKERCTGDVAKRSGNEYQFQELATQNIEDFRAGGVTKILTSCPHCLKTIGDDYRRFGFEAEVVHSSVLVAELTRGLEPNVSTVEPVTFHDPCYLGRYAGHVDEPRELIERFGGSVREPERNRTNPFCCGAGGGLLFEEKEEGTRISDVRFKQLQATGAGTVVTACPFCSIMLKGAQASAQADTEFVDLMTFVNGRLQKASDGRAGGPPPAGDGAAGRAVTDVPAWRRSRVKRAEAAAIAAIVAPLVGLLGRTLRWQVEGLEHLEGVVAGGRQPIMGFWHGRILGATWFFRRRGIVVITSENFDGEWIARIIERFGYRTARGSSSRGALRALLQLKRDLGAGPARSASRSTGRGGRRGARSPAPCGSPAPPASPSCRSTWRPPGTGRRGAGTGRRSRSRSAPSRSPSAGQSTCRPRPTSRRSRRSASSSKPLSSVWPPGRSSCCGRRRPLTVTPDP